MHIVPVYGHNRTGTTEYGYYGWLSTYFGFDLSQSEITHCSPPYERRLGCGVVDEARATPPSVIHFHPFCTPSCIHTSTMAKDGGSSGSYLRVGSVFPNTKALRTAVAKTYLATGHGFRAGNGGGRQKKYQCSGAAIVLKKPNESAATATATFRRSL